MRSGNGHNAACARASSAAAQSLLSVTDMPPTSHEDIYDTEFELYFEISPRVTVKHNSVPSLLPIALIDHYDALIDQYDTVEEAENHDHSKEEYAERLTASTEHWHRTCNQLLSVSSQKNCMGPSNCEQLLCDYVYRKVDTSSRWKGCSACQVVVEQTESLLGTVSNSEASAFGMYAWKQLYEKKYPGTYRNTCMLAKLVVATCEKFEVDVSNVRSRDISELVQSLVLNSDSDCLMLVLLLLCCSVGKQLSCVSWTAATSQIYFSHNISNEQSLVTLTRAISILCQNTSKLCFEETEISLKIPQQIALLRSCTTSWFGLLRAPFVLLLQHRDRDDVEEEVLVSCATQIFQQLFFHLSTLSFMRIEQHYFSTQQHNKSGTMVALTHHFGLFLSGWITELWTCFDFLVLPNSLGLSWNATRKLRWSKMLLPLSQYFLLHRYCLNKWVTSCFTNCHSISVAALQLTKVVSCSSTLRKIVEKLGLLQNQCVDVEPYDYEPGSPKSTRSDDEFCVTHDESAVVGHIAPNVRIPLLRVEPFNKSNSSLAIDVENPVTADKKIPLIDKDEWVHFQQMCGTKGSELTFDSLSVSSQIIAVLLLLTRIQLAADYCIQDHYDKFDNGYSIDPYQFGRLCTKYLGTQVSLDALLKNGTFGCNDTNLIWNWRLLEPIKALVARFTRLVIPSSTFEVSDVMSSLDLNVSIGHGQFGTVFKSCQSTEPVAVKVVSDSRAERLHEGSISSLSKLATEVLCMEACQSAFPNSPIAVSLYQYGAVSNLEHGTLCTVLVMPLASQSLHAWRKAITHCDTQAKGFTPFRKQLPVYLSILHTIAMHISKIHSIGIVHYDIRCQNILLFDNQITNGHLKPLLSDFGESTFSQKVAPSAIGSVERHIGDWPTVGRGHRQSRGAECIKSPEMLRVCATDDPPTNHVADARGIRNGGTTGSESDVWAYGCLVYELLTGEYLFAQEATERWSQFFVRLAGVTNADLTDPLPLLSAESVSKLKNLFTEPCGEWELKANGLIEGLLRFILVRDPHMRPTANAVVRAVENVMTELLDSS